MWRRKRTARCLQTSMEKVTPQTRMPQPLAQGLQTKLTIPVVTGDCRSCHVLHALMDDGDRDGPDSFFARKKTWRRNVVPAWHRYISPSKVDVNEKAVFFFPAVDRKNSENEGWVNPKMYKRAMLPKKMLRRARRDRKRAWRKLSNRLQDEYRYRRFPRDESGRVIQGTFGNKNHPLAIKMRNK